MSSKSLDAQRNDAARAYTADLIKRRFDGNVLQASKAIGVSQSALYEFLKGSRGAGMKLLDAVARFDHTTVDQVVGNAPAPSDPYPNRAAVMASPEFKDASPAVREAFATLRGATGGADRSVVAWSRVLDDLVKADALGLLESGGGRLLTPPPKTPRK
jgi:hypothetical protein